MTGDVTKMKRNAVRRIDPVDAVALLCRPAVASDLSPPVSSLPGIVDRIYEGSMDLPRGENRVEVRM